MITSTRINHAQMTVAHTNYNQALQRYAASKINHETLGTDLVQDTYIKTWSYIVKGGHIVNMKSFLYHILNGLIIDEYRKRKSTSLDNLLEQGFEPEATQNEVLADLIDGQQVLALIDKLPTSYQTVVYLRYVKELSLEEISVKTGRTKNLVAVQLHRGLEKLRLLVNENMR